MEIGTCCIVFMLSYLLLKPMCLCPPALPSYYHMETGPAGAAAQWLQGIGLTALQFGAEHMLTNDRTCGPTNCLACNLARTPLQSNPLSCAFC
jgi:hypothetical protein